MIRFHTFRRESARHYRRANRFLAAICIAALILGLSSMLYTDSYETLLENQRKSLYGAWHVAGYAVSDAAVETYRAHATVEALGQMTILGTVLADGAVVGGLGTVDATLVELGQLKLLDGTWPTAPGEICAESSCLSRLGFSYELGQTLTLTVGAGDSAVEQDFILTGVLQDYAANWKRDGATLASFVVAQTPSQAATSRHIFLFLRSGYLDAGPDLLKMAGRDGHFVLNDYTYLRYAPANQPAYDRLLLQLLVTGLSCLAMLVLLGLDLRQRRETLVLLRGLGASRGQIALLYLGEKIPVLLLATAAGLILGLGLPTAALVTAAAALGHESLLSLVPLHLFQFLGLYVASLLLALLVGLLRLFQIPLRGKAQQQAAVPRVRRIRHLSPRTIHRVLVSLRPADGWASFGLALFSALVLFFTAYRAWDQWQLYRYQTENYPADYTYGFLQNRFPVRQTMGKETLQAIETTYGVATVRAFALGDPLPMTHSGGFTADYLQAAGAFMGWESGTACGSLLAVSPDALPLYLQTLEPTARQAVQAGEAVLLYVPDMVGDTARDLQPVGTVDGKDYAVSETAVNPGNTLTLSTAQGDVSLNVAGVVHDLSDLPFSLLPIRPYTLLCTEALFEQVLGSIAYGYVEVLGDRGAVSYQTDVALSKLPTTMVFSNLRIERQSSRQELLLQLILSLVLGISCLLLVSMVRFGLESAHATRKQQTRTLLWYLGADREKLRLAEAGVALRHAIVASLWAALALLLWEALDEAIRLHTMANFESFREQLLPLTLQNLAQYTHWGFLALLLTVFWLSTLVRIFLEKLRN